MKIGKRFFYFLTVVLLAFLLTLVSCKSKFDDPNEFKKILDHAFATDFPEEYSVLNIVEGDTFWHAIGYDTYKDYQLQLSQKDFEQLIEVIENSGNWKIQPNPGFKRPDSVESWEGIAMHKGLGLTSIARVNRFTPVVKVAFFDTYK